MKGTKKRLKQQTDKRARILLDFSEYLRLVQNKSQKELEYFVPFFLERKGLKVPLPINGKRETKSQPA